MGGRAVSGTYFSQKFAVPEATERFTAVDSIVAVYSDNLPQGNSVTIGIGFFGDVNGTTNLCTANQSNCNLLQNFQDGYYIAPLQGSGQVLPLDFTSIPSISQTTFVQFKITMATTNYYGDAANQPWVQSVELDYHAEQLGVVGYINRATQIPVTRGQSSTYTFDIIRTAGSNYTGTVT